jgi:Zn finger protein HypA/HybF involved in hydrogenase expression
LGAVGAGLESATYEVYDPAYDQVVAMQIISTFTDANIQDIKTTVYINRLIDMLDQPLDGLFLGLSFDALIEGIWWHLAKYITDQKNVAICRWCGHYFGRTRKTQKFCPSSTQHVMEVQQGARIRAVSLCANRYRLKKHRSE